MSCRKQQNKTSEKIIEFFSDAVRGCICEDNDTNEIESVAVLDNLWHLEKLSQDRIFSAR